MKRRQGDRSVTVGCHEGLWIIDRADARPYHTARLCMALAAVLTALAVWWALG